MRRFSLSLPLLLALLAACAAPSEDATSVGLEAKAAEFVTLRYQPQFVLEKVLEYKNRPLDAAKPFPAIRLASTTELSEFQDAIELQWGFRPETITNAYSVATNTIYLMDGAAYYAQHGRCIDDSLAHELTHYVQVVYQGWHLDGADDSIEMDAIFLQRWFRETYCAAPR